MSAGLAYADLHPEMFSGRLITASMLVPCKTHPDQLYLPPPANGLLGVHVLNKTKNGTAWNATAIDEEIQFLRPILHMLPTFLAGNPETPAIYFLGLVMGCASIYSFPARDFCGNVVDGIDLCAFYNHRYNLYSTIPNLRADFEQGGHWSEPLQSRGTLLNSYSIPIADSKGTFRIQVQMGVGVLSISDLFEALQPSENGYTFLLSKEGHVIYAQQEAIDVLFGAEANLTLGTITSSYVGLEVLVVGVSLATAKTPFAQLPNILAVEQDNLIRINMSNTSSYIVTWTRFANTLSNWYLIGIMPQDELDNAAVWYVSPPWRNLTLTPSRPSANVTFTVVNYGHLPLSFYVGPTPPARGLLISAADARYTLIPGDNKSVVFSVQLAGTPPVSSRFLTPFYATATGYGPCFRPLFADLSVTYLQPTPVESGTYALITMLVLCSITACLIGLAYVMLFRYRHSPPVMAISPVICVFKLLGLVFLLLSAIFNILSPTIVLCEFARWLFNIGFCLTGSSTIAKNYRLRLIFYSKKLHIVPLSNAQLLAFVAAVVLLDVILLSIGTAVEPYTVSPNKCVPQGWVIFTLLTLTKVGVWTAAFFNTISLARIPMAFADSRLNGVLVVVCVLAAIYLGLQFIGVLRPLQLLFIGSMFIWVGAFSTVIHMLLKLRGGYVVKVKRKVRTNSISMTPPQDRLRCRLDALLDEMELKQAKLINDKIASIENLQANQRLLFDLRATLLTFEPQDAGECSLDEEAVEKHLPESIKAAFDKHERAVARRMSGQTPVARRESLPNPERKTSVTIEPTPTAQTVPSPDVGSPANEEASLLPRT